jgi:hypothetical protein
VWRRPGFQAKLEVSMSDTRDTSAGKTPVHLWIVGVLSLLWNAGGAFDYLMTQTHNEAYMSKFTEAQLEFFYGLPAWAVSMWAIAVWGGVAGSLLLLFRKGVAVWIFLISFLAMVGSMIHNYGIANGFEVMGDAFSVVFSILIFVVSAFLYLYARAMAKRDVLV